MKSKKNIKTIFFFAIISIFTLFFINISFATNTAKISVETANLRAEPKADAKILELASKGEEVQIIEKTGDWYKVKYKDITGYLRNDLLSVTSEVSTTTTSNNEVSTNSENTANTNNATNISNETENNVTQEETTSTSTEVVNTVSEDTNETNNNEVSENIDTKKGTYKVIKESNIKITPLITSLELAKISKDNEIEVSDVINNWAWITTTEGMQGWVRIENLEKIEKTVETTQTTEETSDTTTTEETNTSNQTTTQTKYVNTQTVNLREKADKTSKVITLLEINSQVTVISEENGWAYVEVNGKKGYVSATLLSTSKQETSRSSLNTRETANTAENATQSNIASTTSSQNGSSVISYANQFLGYKYVYGGTTTSGFDCSGFTQYVYKNFGVSLNRTAADQYNNGTKVTDLQTGDLVMFGKSGINHVGIYIGGGSFIHAANSTRGVTTDTLTSGYYKTNYAGATRVLN